jgi:arylsulfatase A-like enzyme
VLISLDTFRADRVAPWGGAANLAPNLNALSAKGMAFTSCFAPAPETLPSHATLLTGAFPSRTGLHNNGLGRLAPGVPTMAETLSARGYSTAAIIASPVLNSRYGLARGFALYDDMMGTSGSRPAGEITDRALAILKAPRKGPLFLWVHFFDTHFPYQVPDDFARATTTLPYDAAVGYVDSEVGRLLRALPANTVVAVVSDHGEALGDHGEPTHGVFLFQPTMQVVCLLCGPGVPAGKTSAVACSLADVASSLCALASVPASGLKSQGQDLMALSKAPGRAGRALPLEAWLPFAQFR